MFLSIVIPVYNVKNYLKRCINSILRCKLDNYEIILVNDGSTDDSYNICLYYEKTYKEIKLINQKNGGLSNARNTGFNNAKGKYITFIDSDDYIISKNFYKLINQLQDKSNFLIDVIVSDFFRVSSKNDEIIARINQIDESKELICDKHYMMKFLEKYGCFWNTWRFVYRREFLNINNFKFKEGFLCEDIDFSVKTLLSCNNIAFYHNPYYCYMLGRETSIMNNITLKRISDYLCVTRESIDLLEKNKELFFSNRMEEKLILEYILNLATIYEVKLNDRKEGKKLFKESSYILKIIPKMKYKLFYFLINIFGISVISFILFLLKKLRRILRIWKMNILKR
ncbi:glycosyltransferase [Clostridium botulinum]|nr:glycosyltransferase [Clostridium botulinum]